LYPNIKPFFIQPFTGRGTPSVGKSIGLKDISDFQAQHTVEETKVHLQCCMKVWEDALR